MGRGRAKAKQTKVARELKYSSPTTDFASLQRELSGHSRDSHRSGVLSDDSDDGKPPWEEDDDYDDWRR
ncbi:DUF3073 domain-containing protein [Nocardia sp. CDC159]|uniref:DUF3073 domain-containing protein n=1 Tax=Nocardia pulmonis TaxID=2951408 RepID=A0A9X2E4K9_9NOCA|nr:MULTISPECIES: DUF3073 domain-containing protein [Nocardia]MCM6772968.1 DUF3073 domain-containing protein [Nocardia pulmonis]MCM6785729.1 DUF3073 domain-containing protein [Nocardia sp. CDC159]